jgi:hypothetical protein
MVTNTITPAINKAQVFTGVRKLSDALQILAETSANVGTNAGAFYLVSGNDAGANYSSAGVGTSGLTVGQVAKWVGNLAPDTAVLTATHDIAGDLSVIRRNGVSGTNAVGDKGTGNFLAYPLYIGRRGGTSFPFNGQIYSLIVRFGANLTTDTITSTETYVNGKTGAY